MKISDYGVEITRVKNGFACRYPTGDEGLGHFEVEVFSDSEDDELASGEDLLWWLVDYFGIGGSRYDKKRLVIRRVRGDKYEPPARSVKEAE